MNARSLSRARSASAVPAYSSDGRRLRNYSLAAVEQLLTQTPPRCSVKRSKTGRITSVQLFPLPQNSPAVGGKERLRKTIHVGQRYSFREQVDDSGRKAWRHVPLLTPREEAVELFLMKIFRAVPLSCLPPAHEDAAPAENDPDPEPPPAAPREIRARRRPLFSSESQPVALAA